MSLDAVLDLTRENSEVRAGLAVGSEEKMTVAASAGYRAAEIKGEPLNLCALPEPLRTRFLERQPIAIEHAEGGNLRKELGLASETRPLFMTPLFIQEELKGAIGVTSESPLSTESKDGLEALSFQVALALESVAFAEDRHWRQSEVRFRSLIQNSSDIIVVLGAYGAITYVSPSVQRMLGYAPEDLIGEYNFTLLHPDDVERVRNFHTKAVSIPGVAPALEVRLRHLDGSWRYVEGVGNNLLDDPDVRGIVVNMRDTTERKQAEKSLRESEANLAKAQKVAHLGSWSVELLQPGMPREKRGMYWSDEMFRIFGFTSQEFVPNSGSPIESVHPEDREYVKRALQDSVSRGEHSLTIEHRVLRPDGKVRFVQAQMENVFDENGELLRRFGTVLDITDRKQAEEALRLSESRLLAAQRIAHVGNWSFDVINNEAHWSDEMYRIFGLEPQEELTLTYKRFLRHVHPDDRRLIQKTSREALSGEVPSRLDYRAVRPDGEVRFVHSQYEIEYDASSRVVELIGTLQDITEQKRAEEELRRSEERFRSLVQNSLDVVMVVDADATITYYSPSVETVTGYKPERFIGKNTLEASPIHPEDLPWARDLLGYVVGNPGATFSVEMRMHHADGSWRVMEAAINNLLDNPSVGGIVVNYRDVTERKVFEKQLEHQALHDDLTGLPNRILLTNRLDECCVVWQFRKESIRALVTD